MAIEPISDPIDDDIQEALNDSAFRTDLEQFLSSEEQGEEEQSYTTAEVREWLAAERQRSGSP
ncbi:MAG: hypothetical protein ACREN8_12635 [Candidatus Dormibacteraceae bacterium]